SLDLRVSKRVELLVNTSGGLPTQTTDFLHVKNSSDSFVRKLSIDSLGSWRFTGHLRSAEDGLGNPLYDIQDWNNIKIAGSVTAGQNLAINGTATVQGSSLFNNTLTATQTVLFTAAFN